MSKAICIDKKNGFHYWTIFDENNNIENEGEDSNEELGNLREFLIEECKIPNYEIRVDKTLSSLFWTLPSVSEEVIDKNKLRNEVMVKINNMDTDEIYRIRKDIENIIISRKN